MVALLEGLAEVAAVMIRQRVKACCEKKQSQEDQFSSGMILFNVFMLQNRKHESGQMIRNYLPKCRVPATTSERKLHNPCQ